MKQIIILLIAVILFTACEQKTKDVQKLIIIKQAQDTIVIDHEPDKLILVVTKKKQKLFNSFRPAIRDVAYYTLLNHKSYKLNEYYFVCGKFKFWVASGYKYFELQYPVEMELRISEKQYFWKIYTDYKNDKMRLFKYEDEIEIILQ